MMETRSRRLVALSALGLSSTCDNLDVLELPDDGGSNKEHVLHAVGQHIALLSVEDGELKFLTCQCDESRLIAATSLDPSTRIVAVGELHRSQCVSHQDGDSKFLKKTCSQQDTSEQEAGHSCVALYRLSSGSCVKTLPLPAHTMFITMAWSADSKRLVVVTADRSRPSGERSADKSSLLLWQWEKDRIEASSTLAVRMNKVRTSSLNGKFCVSTLEQQHIKLWLLEETGLRAQTLFSTQENCDYFVDHQWAHSELINNRRVGKQEKLTSDLTEHPGLNSQSSSQIILAATTHSKQNTEPRNVIFVIEVAKSSPCIERSSKIEVPAVEGHLQALAIHSRGFCVAGTLGLFAVYECQKDRGCPYALLRCSNVVSVFEGPSPTWSELAMTTSGAVLVARAKNSGLYSINLEQLYTSRGSGDFSSEGFVSLPQKNSVHEGAILGMDISVHKPLVATCGVDNTIRVYDYTRKCCELIHDDSKPGCENTPNCISLHPCGLQLAVGYAECLRLFSILFRTLKPLHQFPLANCHALKYANGGHQFACGAGIQVVVYSAISMLQLHNFTGHVSPITCIDWAKDDLSLFSAGSDGALCGWDLVDAAQIEPVSQLNGTSQFCSLVSQMSIHGEHSGPVGIVVGATLDGMLKEAKWTIRSQEHAQVRELWVTSSAPKIDGQDHGATLTALAVASSVQSLVAGTSMGTIRLYTWPVVANNGLLTEFEQIPAHSGSITAMQFSDESSLLFSAATDGLIFIFSISLTISERHEGCADSIVKVNHQDLDMLASLRTNVSRLVQVGLSELHDNASTIVELREKLQSEKAENEYAWHKKEQDWQVQVKCLREEHRLKLASEQAKFEKMHQTFTSSICDHHAEMAQRSSHHAQVTRELENQYEHKLALEMERYDHLSEEIESIQQRCEGLLRGQANDHEMAIRDADGRTRRLETELRQQIERLHDDSKHNEQMFREVLDQQEHEYELELQQLMAAAQTELTIERENTAEARGLVQTRNTKISRLNKRMDELKTSSHARNVLLTAEKVRNAKLEATLKHFKRHMEERESTLEDKELSILSLHRKNVTLDNFRFVLDHRVQQLLEERGPIAQHVEGLEAHISAMYDELETEYYEKKKQGQQLDSKEMKVQTLTQEAGSVRGLLREREAYVASFKRELSTLVELSTPKDLEEGVKRAYHKYVKDEAPRHKIKHAETPHAAQLLESAQGSRQPNGTELDLIDALVEAHSQRKCVQQAAANTKHRLDIAKNESQRTQQVKLGENSQLIAECNLLRGENFSLLREVNHLRQVVKDYDEASAKRREKLRAQKIVFRDDKSNPDQDQKVSQSRPHSVSVTSGGELVRRTKIPQSQGRHRCSTKALTLLSERDAKIVQMEAQLDANARIIETQITEIKYLQKNKCASNPTGQKWRRA